MESPENKKKIFCSNCGKIGHINKKCQEPTTSLGVICVLLPPEYIEEIKDLIQNKEYRVNLEVENQKKLSNLGILKKYKDKIKFLLICRKHSLNYLEFIRGRYDPDNNEELKHIFGLITPKEKEWIKNQTFETCWIKLWKKTSNLKAFQNEYNMAIDKYNQLKNKNDFDLNYFVNYTSLFNEPEWGFPKGRRNHNEKNINCAIREFEEEGGLKKNEYYLLNNLNHLIEIFNGTNEITYKHIYYVAISSIDRKLNISIKNKTQIHEIGNIGWFTYQEAVEKIRPYHQKKKNLIYEIYIYFSNLMNQIDEKNNQTNIEKELL